MNVCPLCCANAADVLNVRDMTHLQGTIHHTNDVVELLMVQYGTVLLDMKTEFLSETLASCFTFQCAQCSWQRLPERGRQIKIEFNVDLVKRQRWPTSL